MQIACSARVSRFASSSFSALTSQMTARPPSAMMRLAVSHPRPEAPPVITAVRPPNRPSNKFISGRLELGCVEGDHALPLLAKFRDSQMHLVTLLEEDGVGFLAFANAGRSAGDQQVPGMERHEPADVGDAFGDGEDHRGGVSGLHSTAVDLEKHVERLRVADLVGGDEPRADRTEGVAALALVPLRPEFLLEV